MRLFFSFGGNHIGIDTRKEIWTDFFHCEEDIKNHTFIEIEDTDGFCALGREIEFNCFDYVENL